MKGHVRILAAAVLLALAPLAQAQTSGGDVDSQVRVVDNIAANRGQTQVATRIASSFTNLAGSEDNALALVRALREGTTVKLTSTATAGTGTNTSTTTTTSFTPATGKMGWGNVRIALALAQDALLKAGITKPTAEQLQAALNGGDVTVNGKTVSLQGVLQMRADGMGWGQIAQANGTKLGPVMSSLKSTQAELARLPATGTGGDAATAEARVGKSKGVTTADGSSTSTPSKGPSKGITTATGATSTASSRGLVTADGATAGSSPKGNAYGRGIVTGSGTGGGNVAATSGKGHGSGAGVVTATGSGAGSVTTAQGNSGNGQGNGQGKGGGNGKGHGG